MHDDLLARLRRRASDPATSTDELFGPPPGAPADSSALAAVETALQLRLPELFRRAYLEIGNGHWGPGYGLLEASKAVPAGHLLFCEWGRTVYSVLDTKTGRIGLTDRCSKTRDTLWQKARLEDGFGAWPSKDKLFSDLEDR